LSESPLNDFEIIGLVVPKGSRNAILETAVDAMVSKGLVYKEYLDHMIKREESFPTGLLTHPVAVAIPHADPDYVIKPGIVIMRVKEGVIFRRMDIPEKEVRVEIIIVLAVDKEKRQIPLLQSVMGIIQNAEQLDILNSCESGVELAECFYNSAFNPRE
jgi:PTS system galactitol-specific IIA component